MMDQDPSATTMDDCDELPFVIDKSGTGLSDDHDAVGPAIDRKKSTIFIRNLPFDFTDEQLERKFEEVGPVKRAFIVTGKGNQGSRGYGFIIYADEADALSAIKQFHQQEFYGRKIKVELAHAPSDSSAPSSSAKTKPHRRQFSKKQASPGHENVIVLEGLSTTITRKFLEKKVRKFGPIETFDYPAATSTSTSLVACITYVLPESARKAVRHFDKKTLSEGSESIRAGFADAKVARVIVRNIPFNCKEKRLRIMIGKIGEIDEINLPMNPEKTLNRGFCFVQFKQFDDAAKAVTQGSLELGGRTIAIDWALSKTHYTSHQANENNDAGDSEDESEGDEEKIAEEKDGAKTGDEDCQENIDDENENEQEPEVVKPIQKTIPEKDRISRDVQEERTVFVRNLPFDANEDQISELFSGFGPVKCAKIVMDKAMNRPKGTAFVQFLEATAAAAAVRASSKGWVQVDNKKDRHRPSRLMTDKGLELLGRTLDVTLAVDRSRANELEEGNLVRKKEDRKNAHLAREGYINAESPAAEGLTKIDLALRSKLYKETTKKLANPNYVMSKVRLSVHNLPEDFDEKRLKIFSIKAVREADPSARPLVKQCIIVRDKERVDAEGQLKSLRYGFIEFMDHDHAMLALRALNNKPNAFGPKTYRPIIMFAVDDMRKLALRKTRLDKSKRKLKVHQLQKELEGGPKTKKQKDY